MREDIMVARDAMTISPATTTADTSVAYAAELMRDWDTGIIPVVADGVSRTLVGVITDRDIIVRCIAARHIDTCGVVSHMTTQSLATVSGDTPLETCIQRMEEAQVRRLPVVESDGRLIGMLSLADVARKLSAIEPKSVAALVAGISQPKAVHAG
jgi:CBS domain-containing protein